MLDESPTITMISPVASGERLDVTLLWWPTYTRETVAEGGDFRVTSSFGVRGNAFEFWLNRFLGWFVEEKVAGRKTFYGRINRVTVNVQGNVITRSLDSVFNHIRVRYSANSTTPTSITAAFENETSQRLYGERQRVDTLDVFTDSGGANAYATSLLTRYGLPHTQNTSMQIEGDTVAVVTVEVVGSIWELKYQHYEATVTAFVDADTAITDALGMSNGDVTEGRIDANTIQVARESELVPIWDRIKAIATMGDANGNLWLVGCFGHNQLDYYEVPITAIAYYAELGEDNRMHYFDQNHYPIPAAILQPGRVVWRRDLLVGRSQNRVLIHDPRATLIGRVRYSRRGVTIQGLDVDESGYIESLKNSVDRFRGRTDITRTGDERERVQRDIERGEYSSFFV